MKKLLFLLVFCIFLTGCARQTDTVILVATPTPAQTAAQQTPVQNSPATFQTPAASSAAAQVASETPAPTPILEIKPSPTPELTPSPTPQAEAAQPPLLEKIMAALGKDLSSLSYEQIVLVSTSGSSCKLYTYERGQDGVWVKILGTSGHVGRNGVTSSKKEGDKKTPAGIYRLGFAFGHDDNPNPDYPWRSITADSYWVDDPDSQVYNQWVEGTENKDWNSAESLSKIKTDYALAVVVEYNYGSSVEPGKGSAIFLHVGDSSTSGCIAIPKSDLKSIIRWLDKDKSPRIVIVAQ